MASIEARAGQKKTSYRVIWRDTDGKKQSKSWPDLRSAELWKSLIEAVSGDSDAAARHLAQTASEAMTVAAVSEHRLGLIRGSAFTKQTYESYMRNHIGPAFGDWPVDTVEEDDCTRFILSLESKGLSPKYIHNISGWLTSIFSHARDRGWCALQPVNPQVLPEVLRTDDDEASMFLTRGEAESIIERMPQVHRLPAILMLSTGLRPAEMRALKISDVYLEATQPVVRVTKAVKQDRVRGEYIGPPKSQKAIRSLGLPPSTVERLLPHTEGRKAAEYLFPGRSGEWIPESTFYQAFTKGVKLARADGVLDRSPSPYSLRHTHASLMADAGMPLWQLSRHMGHANQKITEDVYVHLYADAQYQAANFAAIAMGEAPKQISPH